MINGLYHPPDASRMNCFARVCCCVELGAEPEDFWVPKGSEGTTWHRKIAWAGDPLQIPHRLQEVSSADVEGLWCLVSRRETPVGATECRNFPSYFRCPRILKGSHGLKAVQLIINSWSDHRVHQNPNLWGFAGISCHQRRRTERPWKCHGSSPAMPSYAQLCAMPSQARVEVDRGEAGGGNGRRVALKSQVISSWIILICSLVPFKSIGYPLDIHWERCDQHPILALQSPHQVSSGLLEEQLHRAHEAQRGGLGGQCVFLFCHRKIGWVYKWLVVWSIFYFPIYLE